MAILPSSGRFQCSLSLSKKHEYFNHAMTEFPEPVVPGLTDVEYRNVVNSVGEGFIVLDKNFFILDVNNETLRLNRRSRGELVGRDHWEVWPETIGTPIENAYRKVMAERVAVTCKYQLKFKRGDCWLEIRAYPVEAGMAAFFRDVTHAEQALIALQESEDRFRAALAATGVMWTNDSMGRMTGEQAGWASLTGQSQDEYQNFGWAAALHPDDAEPTITAWNAAVAERRTFEFEHRVRRHDGAWRDFAVKAVPVITDCGTVREWVGVHTDITDRKKGEEALHSTAGELALSDRRKSEFISTLAHELRNPLAPIRNGLQVLRMAPDNLTTVSRVTAVMDRQVAQMVHLIDDLLDMARISRGQIEVRRLPVDLKQIVAIAIETSQPIIEASHHDLSVDIGNTPLILLADATRIAQVISNLLNNAAKYTPPYGQIFLNAKREDDMAVITVLDTGIGIPPESMAGIFDMFSQVAEHRLHAQGGLGIGLSLVHTLVQLHGGSINAFSGGEGMGSNFVVKLPLASSETDAERSSHFDIAVAR